MTKRDVTTLRSPERRAIVFASLTNRKNAIIVANVSTIVSIKVFNFVVFFLPSRRCN